MNCSSNNSPCNECKLCLDINNGTSIDVIELNAADKRRIEDIRDCLEKLRFKPMSKYKILILDEVHMLTTEAFNALLKDLEEPPEYVIFILCTTNPEKIPNTIVSRCQTFQFKSVNNIDIVNRLIHISDNEVINAIYEKDMPICIHNLNSLPVKNMQQLFDALLDSFLYIRNQNM